MFKERNKTKTFAYQAKQKVNKCFFNHTKNRRPAGNSVWPVYNDTMTGMIWDKAMAEHWVILVFMCSPLKSVGWFLFWKPSYGSFRRSPFWNKFHVLNLTGPGVVYPVVLGMVEWNWPAACSPLLLSISPVEYLKMSNFIPYFGKHSCGLRESKNQ